MRPALALVLLAVATAAAQPARPKRAPPEPTAILGSAKEEEPAPLPASAPACPEHDTALLRAVLYAFEPAPEEIRVTAVEDLALLGDARALNALTQLVFDQNLAVQAAAIRSVSRFQTPRAEEILANVIRHPQLPALLKLQSVEAMVLQRSATARELLLRVSRSTSYGHNISSAARLALERWGPPPADATAQGATR
ncbi:MAG: HEAT repeat domain-containing protein [Myxococcales bacterium]|nr:HEAT repeat domain-containing protein [Myxococcales bacterium]